MPWGKWGLRNGPSYASSILWQFSLEGYLSIFSYLKRKKNSSVKAVGMAIAYSYGFMMKLINEPVFALLDSGYFIVSHFFKKNKIMWDKQNILRTFNKLRLCVWFFDENTQVSTKGRSQFTALEKVRVTVLTRNVWSLRSVEEPIVPLGSAISDTTNQYFNMLEDSWKWTKSCKSKDYIFFLFPVPRTFFTFFDCLGFTQFAVLLFGP